MFRGWTGIFKLDSSSAIMGVFQFNTFLSVPFSESRFMFTVGVSSILWNSFFMLFIYSAFPLFSFCSHISLQNWFASFVSSCSFALVFFDWFLVRILFRFFFFFFFFFFLKVLLCLYCLTMFRYFSSPSFLQTPFDLIISVELFVLTGFIFFRSFHSIVPEFVFGSFGLPLVLTVFLFVFLASFSIQVLYFPLGSLEGYQFYYWLILPLHKLDRLVRWCCPLGYFFKIY